MAVDDVTVMSMIPSLFGRYQKLTLNKAIEINPEWTWCPANSCNMVIKINYLGAVRDISASRLVFDIFIIIIFCSQFVVIIID